MDIESKMFLLVLVGLRYLSCGPK